MQEAANADLVAVAMHGNNIGGLAVYNVVSRSSRGNYGHHKRVKSAEGTTE